MNRRSPLDHRAFRGLLLGIAGVPISGYYLWQSVVVPILAGGDLGDLQQSYMPAAARVASGLDPYELCRTMGCLEPTGPQYVMPPLLAWLLQPAAGLPDHVITIGAVILLNLSLVAFIWLSLKALKVHDWQLAALLILVALGFEPTVANVAEGQVNLVLLALSAIWLLAWVQGAEGRWWGGPALGAAIALKLIQGPVVLLLLWARRWAMLAAAAVTGLVLWLAGAPQYLAEYLLKVLPAVSAGTGFFENHSPGGTIARLIQPDTFLGATRGSPPLARVITITVAAAALVVTFLVLHSPAASATGRSLEAAAIVAVTPLVATYSWGTHLVLLLLPMFCVVVWAVRRRDWMAVSLVAAGWLLIGPGHKWFQALLVSGYPNLVVLRLMAEFGVVGILAVWAATLVAVRRERSANRPDATHHHGAHEEKEHRAGEDHAIAGVPADVAVQVVDQGTAEQR